MVTAFVVAGCALIAAALLYFQFHLPRRRAIQKARAYFQRALLSVGGNISSGFYSVTLAGARHGKKFLASIEMSTNNGKPTPIFRISLENKMAGHFSITPSLASTDPITDLTQTISLSNVAPQTTLGDISFDSRHRTLSFHGDFVRKNLSSPRKIQAIERAFSLGAVRMDFDGRSLALLWSPFDLDDLNADSQLLNKAISDLYLITEGMTPAAPLRFGEIFDGMKKADILYYLLILVGMLLYAGLKFYSVFHKAWE